jgi:hypothetical protein
MARLNPVFFNQFIIKRVIQMDNRDDYAHPLMHDLASGSMHYNEVMRTLLYPKLFAAFLRSLI